MGAQASAAEHTRANSPMHMAAHTTLPWSYLSKVYDGAPADVDVGRLKAEGKALSPP